MSDASNNVNKEQEAMMIARALRMGLERDAGPGNSVNSTQNPYIIALQGHFDLLKVARIVGVEVENWQTYQAELAAKAAREAAKLAALDAPLEGPHDVRGDPLKGGDSLA
jgi:hypothetical protein